MRAPTHYHNVWAQHAPVTDFQSALFVAKSAAMKASSRGAWWWACAKVIAIFIAVFSGTEIPSKRGACICLVALCTAKVMLNRVHRATHSKLPTSDWNSGIAELVNALDELSSSASPSFTSNHQS